MVALTNLWTPARVVLPLLGVGPASGTGVSDPRVRRALREPGTSAVRRVPGRSLKTEEREPKASAGGSVGSASSCRLSRNTVAPRPRSKRRQLDAESNPIGSLISREACFPGSLDGEFDPGSGRTL